MHAEAPSPTPALQSLERRVAHDLSCLNQPAANWVPERRTADGRPLLDVLVVGGGMCGQTVAQALLREGVRNLRVIDRADYGAEGPWGTFARMQTLRSPKHLTGPDLGVPSLTYRAWHEAQYGVEHWSTLHKIDRLDWLRYLLWVRKVSGVPVENSVAMTRLEPGADHVEVRLRAGGREQPVAARQVVLALGRDGTGAPRRPSWPSFGAGTSHPRVFHSADDIDFGALRGTRVAVLGAGASAFDNAATALEAGASTVAMFARRDQMPQVNKSKWTAFPGFLHGFAELPDAWRWRFYTYIFDEQVPPPWESVLRCDRHPAFSLHLGEGWDDVVPDDRGVAVRTRVAHHRFDTVILATGFDVDLFERDEFSVIRSQVTLWGERVAPVEAAAHPEAARFPYLGPGFELVARDPATMPGLPRIRLFNWGSTMSHGAIAGDIPGLGIGARRLARAIVTRLFIDDVDAHWGRLQAHNEEELVQTRWFVPLARRPR